MWTANITNKQLKNGHLIVNIDYTDGVSVLTDIYDFSSVPDLNSAIKVRISELESLKIYADSIILGQVDISK